MRLPYLPSGGKASALSERIGGLCLIGEYKNGSLGAGMCLSSQDSPALGQRRPPVCAGEYPSPWGMCVNGGLAIISQGRVIYNGQDLGEISQGVKHMAAIGDKIIIFPDKLYIDINQPCLKEMEIGLTVEGVEFTDGSITSKGAAWPFETGDGVEISGCVDYSQNNLTLVVRGVEGDSLTFDANAFEGGVESGQITVRRKIPQLEVVCESGNRLWGCEGDTIYSSKLGDPMNFFVYDGLSTDSYALKTSGGGFTACGQYASHIMFFKENMAYKLYGTRPSNYQLMAARIPGVRRGCGGTLWTDSEDMYYLGTDGFYAYSGGVPQLLSFELGHIIADAACGGVWKGRYYLSITSGSDSRILEYDIMRQQWMPWGAEQAVDMAAWNGDMYMLCRDGKLLSLDGGEGFEDWNAELRPFHDLPGRNISSMGLVIDARPQDGAWLAVDFARQGQPYCQAAMWDSTFKGVRQVMLPPNRGGDLWVRLRGHGRCPVYAIERTFRMGSEI